MATEAKGQRVNINGTVTDVLYKDETSRNTLSQLTYPGHDQAIMGTDSYVCDVGQKFALTLVSNTSLKLADGEGVLQGVRFRIPYGSTVALTIAAGTSGYKRIDLVVARYSKSTGAINFVVIKGTNGTSPAIPAYNTGSVLGGAATVDFPLYKITLDGTTVSSVDKLFTQLQTMAELQTAVNKLNTDIPAKFVKSFTVDSIVAGETKAYQITLPTQNYISISVCADWSDVLQCSVAIMDVKGIIRVYVHNISTNTHTNRTININASWV